MAMCDATYPSTNVILTKYMLLQSCPCTATHLANMVDMFLAAAIDENGSDEDQESVSSDSFMVDPFR